MNGLNAYQTAVAELNNYVNYERTADYPVGRGGLSTARMEQLLTALKNPEQRYLVLHIAGTKGKGSTAYLTAALLRALDIRVGLYTSPHIICLRERVQIDGRLIAPDAFVAAYQKVKIAAEKIAAEKSAAEKNARPTYFEMLTATALQAFADAGIAVAVIEVGLGGRLDATNVATLPVAASAITKISYDHTQILGTTLEAIAAEKAGILRARTPLIMSPQTRAADLVLRRRAETLNCPLIEIGKNLLPEPTPKLDEKIGRQFFNLRLHENADEKLFRHLVERVYEKIPLNLLGAHQRENAAVALGLVAALLATRPQPLLITHTHLATAWKNVRVPGRLEIVKMSPLTLLDAAHNQASAWALIETLREHFAFGSNRKKIGVIAISHDKNPAEILRIMLPFFDRVFFTTHNSPRATPPATLQAIGERVAPTVASETIAEPLTALHAAELAAGETGVIVVTGSFYIVGDVRAACLNIPVEQ